MPLRDLMTKDLSWKIFSIVLATAIWLTVHALSANASKRINPLDGMMTRTFEAVPVLVVSAAADVREFKVNPRFVQVVVSGKPEIVNTLETKQIHVLVDLTGVVEAVDLKKRVDVSMPAGVTFVSALPGEVDIAVPAKK